MSRQMAVGVRRVAYDAQPVADPGWKRGPSLVGALWRYKWPVLIFALISAMAGYFYTAAQPPEYEATGRVTLTSPFDRTLFRHERGVPYVEIDRYLSTQANRMTSPDVLAAASELLGRRLGPGQIRQLIQAQSSTSVLEVTVRARDDDPTQAADVVNAVMQAYQDVAAAELEAQVEASLAQLAELEANLEERLEAVSEDEDSDDPLVQSLRTSLSNEITGLQTRAGQIRADSAVYGTGVERVYPAAAPELPVSETPRRMAAVFGALGFIAAIIVAFWRSERTRVVNGADDASGPLDTPLLGVISTNGPRTPAAAAPVVTAPDSAAAREHQFIASKLSLLGGDSEPRVIMVTSPGETPGKSVAALNLALSTALDRRTVILADVDARGWLTDLLGARGKSGISDLLAWSAYGDVVIDDCVAAVDELPTFDSFRFIPAGTVAGEGGKTTAGGAQMSKLLAKLLQEADIIVLDGPAFLESPAATRLAADADGVVLVVPRGTKAEDLQKTTELIHLARTAPAGYIFDRSRAPGRWRLWPRLYQPIAAKLSRS